MNTGPKISNISPDLAPLANLVANTNDQSIVSSSELSSMSQNQVTARHCAFCLKFISGSSIKKCGGCKKRVYCSKECQVADWSITGNGQRHKNWCGLHVHGEEDIDWVVTPVPNKGLGVRAKRFIPAGYRIIVEPVYNSPYEHSAIKDLEPKGGSLEDKFKLNCFGNQVGPRTSRVNHSCRPNAGISYDKIACVRILVAQKDIQQGEEITLTYSHFGSLETSSNKESDNKIHAFFRTQYGYIHPDAELSPEELEFANIRRTLRVNWGITCSTDCYCNDSRAKKLVVEGTQLYHEMLLMASKGRINEALEAGDKLLKIQGELNTSWTRRFVYNFYLFEIAMGTCETEAKARQYLRSALYVSKILYPYSEDNKMYELLSNHPETLKYHPYENKLSMVMQKFSCVLNGKK